MTDPSAANRSADESDYDEADSTDTVIPDLEPVSYFGTDFDVHGLVRRLNAGDIIVPNFDPAPESGGGVAGFQRKFVWKKTQMDRFIESLLLGFPVPGIFLVQQANKQLLVLDGQQRLKTLQRFYAGTVENKTEFKLDNVAKGFKGLTYDTLPDELRRTLDNTFIHATIVKHDDEAAGQGESVYSIFERLNTGGTNLYPQEIRVALYHGPLADFLKELNSYSAWREIYGPPSERLKDQEIILRFLAFWKNEENYQRPLKVFLNDFLADHRDMENLDGEELRRVFYSTCDIASQGLGRQALRPEAQINAAFADAVLAGLADRVKDGEINNPDSLKDIRHKLLSDVEFRSSIARATADEDRVATRLQKARDAFKAAT